MSSDTNFRKYGRYKSNYPHISSSISNSKIILQNDMDLKINLHYVLSHDLTSNYSNLKKQKKHKILSQQKQWTVKYAAHILTCVFFSHPVLAQFKRVLAPAHHKWNRAFSWRDANPSAGWIAQRATHLPKNSSNWSDFWF